MTGSKILWGQMLAAVLAVGGMLWAATEWTAWRLGFQAALGSPWFSAFGWPIYQPHQFFAWWYHFDAYAPVVFLKGAGVAASGGVLAIVVAIAASVQRAKYASLVTTYGSARWASVEEVRATGMLQPAGVHLGRLGHHHLRHSGPEHVLCFAPTRSGKGVGLVVPTLLSWRESCVVHDRSAPRRSATTRTRVSRTAFRRLRPSGALVPTRIAQPRAPTTGSVSSPNLLTALLH